jgi:prepilin-type N-terminal cleavage/methylation domain-containing protein
MLRRLPLYISVAHRVKKRQIFYRSAQFSASPATAFSLVEILVVIAIVAILAALAPGLLQGMIKRGHLAVTAANRKQIGAAMPTYAAASGGFLPSDMASGGAFWIKELWQIISTSHTSR